MQRSQESLIKRRDYARAARRTNRASRNVKAARQAAETKAKVAQIKLDEGCADCGYNVEPHALQFDHLPDTEKLYNVSQMYHLAWDRILDEIHKCEVVCANCHAIRTASRRVPGRP